MYGVFDMHMCTPTYLCTMSCFVMHMRSLLLLSTCCFREVPDFLFQSFFLEIAFCERRTFAQGDGHEAPPSSRSRLVKDTFFCCLVTRIQRKKTRLFKPYRFVSSNVAPCFQYYVC